MRPDYDGLVVDPQIGPEVPEFTVTRVARGATYEITVTNSGAAGAAARLTVDGTPVEGNLVPYAAGGLGRPRRGHRLTPRGADGML